MKSKILFIASLIFGLMFVNAGLNKFFNYIPVPENLDVELMNDFGAMQEIIWLMPLLALFEIIGGLLFIIPKTRALGALVIFPILVGILMTHIFVDPSSLPMVLVLTAIFIWVVYENRAKYAPLFK